MDVEVPGPRRQRQATLYDVCRISGTSTATVSRVFSGSGKVSEATRARVLEAAKKLSYVPSHAAMSLSSRRSKTLGVVFPWITGGFYPEVLAGIDEVTSENGFDILTTFGGGASPGRPEVVQRLAGTGRVDALVLLNNRPLAAGLPPGNEFPIVLIDHRSDGPAYPTIGIDDADGVRKMIEHLYAEGCRRIFVLAGINLAYYSRERLLAVMKTMAELGIPLEQDGLWNGDMCVDSGRRAARDFLATGAPLPDAIFCLNDPMAIGVLDVFRKAGVRVPDDVAVAGFDNIEAAEYLSLTTIAVPMREMGRLAARAALRAVLEQKRADDQTVGVELIVRSSTTRRKPR